MELRNPREWDKKEDKVVEHVDNSSRNEEFGHIDAMPFGAAELEPEETSRGAEQPHTCP